MGISIGMERRDLLDTVLNRNRERTKPNGRLSLYPSTSVGAFLTFIASGFLMLIVLIPGFRSPDTGRDHSNPGLFFFALSELGALARLFVRSRIFLVKGTGREITQLPMLSRTNVGDLMS